MYNQMKTASQTDKSTWWSVTAYGDEIALLESTTLPPEVKKVYGGREECPTTKKIHFQGAVQYTKQVRFSAVKKWLPTSHIEAARQEQALIKYVMKPETAVGEKTVRENATPYYPHNAVCKLLASVADFSSEDDEIMFWTAVNKLLMTHQMLSNILSNSSFKSFWLRTKKTWLFLFRQDSGANSITPRPAVPEPVDEDGSDSDTESVCPQCMSMPHHKSCDLISHS